MIFNIFAALVEVLTQEGGSARLRIKLRRIKSAL
jgi:hypothetical protein